MIPTVVTECGLDCKNPVIDNEGKTSSDVGEGEHGEKQPTERTNAQSHYSEDTNCYALEFGCPHDCQHRR
jgi:hypothetical protein